MQQLYENMLLLFDQVKVLNDLTKIEVFKIISILLKDILIIIEDFIMIDYNNINFF